MKVFINNTALNIFKGARLSHVILKYSEQIYKQLMNKQIEIADEKGNLMDDDGQVWEGIKLFTKTKQND